LIGPSAAAAAARAALLALRGPGHAAATAATQSGDVGTPVLVERLDAPGQPYYLVPWCKVQGVALVVQIDAGSGALASMTVLPVPVKHLVMSPQEARALVAERMEGVGTARLVWQPCRESASPLQPFHEVQVPSGLAYVTTDGSVHRQLTAFGRGA
jgi:hypothetical protein